MPSRQLWTSTTSSGERFEGSSLGFIRRYVKTVVLKIAKGEETNNLAGGNQPPASNMRKLVWNDELAVIAQRFVLLILHKSYILANVNLVQVGGSVHL